MTLKDKLKRFLESDFFFGGCVGVMGGIIFIWTIRATYYWIHGTPYPLGY
jgi:hypothetical protein